MGHGKFPDRLSGHRSSSNRYWNRYPGAQCDIESYIYMPLLEETGYMPTEKYTHANELRAHSQAIGEKFGLYERTLFQTEVLSIRWEDSTASWAVKTSRNDNIRATFIVPAAGSFSRPKMPGVSGIECFQGHSFHSSRWDYEYTGGNSSGGLTKLSDKTVGIIGTGATAVQIVPHLGAGAKQLYVFQRTPSSIDVRNNRPTDPGFSATLKPGWQQERMDNFNILVNGGYQKTDLVNDGWTDILRDFLTRHEMGADPATVAERMQQADYKKMNSIRTRVDDVVKNKEAAEGLKPWYNMLCKRPCFHDQYLPTFNRPNVTLVDTHGKGLDSITKDGVIANGEEYKLDCLVYATGFEVSTDWSHRSGMEIFGRGGTTITEKWEDGVATLHGYATRDFPNCFFMQTIQAALTPNHLHVTDEQAKHFAYIVKTCHDRGIRTVEPTQEAEDEWVNTILELSEPRTRYLKECTPGYYNFEGNLSTKMRRNMTYGGESYAFLDLLRNWRDEGNLWGLDARKLERPKQARRESELVKVDSKVERPLEVTVAA